MKPIEYRRALVFLCFCALLFFPLQASCRIIDRITAVVNEDIILLSELNKAAQPYLSGKQKTETVFEIRGKILNSLIEKKLIEQRAKQAGIQISENELDNTIERIKEANHLTHENFLQQIKRNGLTEGEYRETMREELLRTKIFSQEIKSKIVVTNDDIENYYKKNIDKYGQAKKYHLKSFRIAGVKKADAEIKLKAVLKNIKSGQKIKAEKYGVKVVDLGLIQLKLLSSGIRKAVEKIKPGGFTQMIQSGSVFEIIMVQNITEPGNKRLEEVYREIQETVFEEKLNQKAQLWLEKLKTRSYIKIIQ